MIKRILISMLLAGLAVATAHAADIKAGEQKAKQSCASCHGADGNSSIPDNPSLAGQVPGYIADQLKLFKSGKRQNVVMSGMAKPLSDQDIANLDAYYAHQKPKAGVIPQENRKNARRGERLYRGGFVKLRIAACMSCHGPSGHGVPPRYPRVASQGRKYLEQQLLAFKSGKRKSDEDIMNNVAFLLSEQQIKDVSAYMHALP